MFIILSASVDFVKKITYVTYGCSKISCTICPLHAIPMQRFQNAYFTTAVTYGYKMILILSASVDFIKNYMCNLRM
jgi:hypothetical protein